MTSLRDCGVPVPQLLQGIFVNYYMNRNKVFAVLTAAALSVVSFAQSIPEGTPVMLKFDQAVSSNTAKKGDPVRFKVAAPVKANGKTYINFGTPVTGIVSRVSKRGSFGKNARLEFTLNPITVHGHMVTLEPRAKGKEFKGSRTDHAAEASGGGLVLLGPVGLVGGAFVKGKSIEVHPGDQLYTEVARVK